VPPAELLPQRLAAVLAVLYLIFNEGYDEQDHHRGLTAEAIRLARVLVRLMPAKPEPRGLLALMLLHESRRATRTDAGVLVTLENQNPSRWDRALIAEGVHTLNAALAMQATGPYQVQAAIAACHATATDTASTDWAQIAALYTQLARLAPSPVVDLNRARSPWPTASPPAWPWSTSSRRPAGSTDITFCTRPKPTCCDATAAPTKPGRPTSKP
jgi:RNA polymerase sigma-70 factor, ECF subfamily